jgi:hypothetical protein
MNDRADPVFHRNSHIVLLCKWERAAEYRGPPEFAPPSGLSEGYFRRGHSKIASLTIRCSERRHDGFPRINVVGACDDIPYFSLAAAEPPAFQESLGTPTSRHSPCRLSDCQRYWGCS